ncbi:MAG: carbohydrate kinase family protein [Chloroflexi bacterium]|nr:carbohydrate kinase family protein [Chloroflexota bacterium]
MGVLITGSIAYDYLMVFPGYFKEHILPDKIETLSVSFLVDSMKRQRGGVATNIAYNLALLGERPRIMATVGQDFGEYREWLEANGVDTRAIVAIPDDYTASFFVSTDHQQNQIAMFYTGAMAHAAKLSFKEHAGGDKIDLVVISPNDPRAMVQYARECQELGLPYIYDPSQQIIRLSGEELAAGVSGSLMTIVNEYEFEMLKNKTGWSNAKVAAETQVLIVTCGERGSEIHLGNQVTCIPAVPAQRQADPTGVGDAYRAGIIKGYLKRLPWQTTGQMGALAATYALEEYGTQNHRYAYAEFVARYRERFGDANELM